MAVLEDIDSGYRPDGTYVVWRCRKISIKGFCITHQGAYRLLHTMSAASQQIAQYNGGRCRSRALNAHCRFGQISTRRGNGRQHIVVVFEQHERRVFGLQQHFVRRNSNRIRTLNAVQQGSIFSGQAQRPCPCRIHMHPIGIGMYMQGINGATARCTRSQYQTASLQTRCRHLHCHVIVNWQAFVLQAKHIAALRDTVVCQLRCKNACHALAVSGGPKRREVAQG